ncbi:MAG TPA: flagellar hook-basal body complex protein FliE [Alphaproteobacteria bacterium]|jgi:flagellar hook-basal body complex protein FliE
MAIDITTAVTAYAKGLLRGAESGIEPRPSDPTDSFAALVREAAGSAIQSGVKSEAMSAQAIAGKADLNEVVAAVTNAEVTLQTVLAVRDRVIQAYQDIIRMPI